MQKRIAIIGAGASGLVAIKSCRDEGLIPICFETTDAIGGLWRYTEDVTNNQGSVTRTTVINTSKEMMCYSDFPIPADFPNFMHNTKVYEYFKMYAKHFELYSSIRFKHKVVSIRRTKDFDSSGEWTVEYINLKEEGQRKVQEKFQGVLLCSGHHANKREPKFEGMDKFKVQFELDVAFGLNEIQ